jgi:hypothetical protein
VAGNTAQRGGQGNEAGSVYRRGVGAILATHGLRGIGIAELGMPAAGTHPVAIAFETTDDVDDIRCTLADGSRLYLQAKRTYGNDKTFGSAVAQWMAMLDGLRDCDRLVIVSAEAKGHVEALPAALHKRRAGGVLTSSEQNAITALAKAAGLDATSARFDELCAVGHAWHACADSAFDLGHRLCAEMLDGAVVESSHGSAALKVLLAELHSDAGRANQSRLEDWWGWLSDARIPLVAGPTGSAAQRLTAERDAVRAYRELLTRDLDVVEFALLSDVLAPLTVPDLLSTVVVGPSPESSSGQRLANVVRRFQDLVLVGHPGAGKTTAMNQLAARFAGDDTAPLPIVVRLSRIASAVGESSDVTLELLVTDAVARVPEAHRAIMADLARRALTSGFALLICDGLDECHSRASAMVDGLVKLKSELGQDIGVVVTTRASALRSARKLGSEVMHLLSPTRAHAVQAQAMRAAMEQIGLRAAERARREQRLSQIQGEQPVITGVPLLGNLLAVLIGLGKDAGLDGSVANLLKQVITQALSRWETRRGIDSSAAPNPSLAIDSALLWDGYVAIGHLVAEVDNTTPADAVSGVAAMLRSGWGESPKKADALAAAIVDFWDATISVFIEEADGILTPRSRVFADLADATWMLEASDTEQTGWIERVLGDETRSDNLILAVRKNPDIADLALICARDRDQRRTLVGWLCDAAAQIELGQRCLQAMLDTLVAEAHDAGDWLPPRPESDGAELFWSQDAQDKKDGRAWPFVRRAALLPLPPELRRTRDALIERVMSDTERSSTAAVLAATADAAYDERPLTGDEREHVTALLALPLPLADDAERLITKNRNTLHIRPTEPMLSGRPEAVLCALQGLDELTQDVVDAMSEFTSWVPDRYVSEIEAEVVRRGMSYSPTEKHSAAWRRLAVFDEPSALPAALADVALPAPVSAGTAWWCREFFALYQLMDVGKAPAAELRYLASEPDRSTLVALARLYCDVNGLDADVLAAQVSQAVRHGEEELSHLRGTAYRNHSSTLRMKSLTVIDDAQRITLRAALTSPCGWLGWLAMMVAQAAIDDELSELLVADLPRLHPVKQRWAVFAACHLATDSLGVAARLADADVSARAATAEYLRHFGDSSEAAEALVGRLRNDDDLQVQLAAGHKGPVDAVAKVWTCWHCVEQNVIAAEDCVHCVDGARPEARAR